MDGKYYNLWSTDNERTDANDDVVIKTVYDPSPVGYSLPASNAFTGFTTTGGNIGIPPTTPATPEQINAKQPFDKGYYFYTKQNKQGEIIYFKLSGCRRGITGILQAINSRGWNWYAIPNTIDSKLGKVFDFQQFDIRPLDIGNPRSDGMSVRSAEERKWRKVDVGCRDLQCADFRCASSSPRTARVPSIYDVMDDTVAHCNSYNSQKD